MTNLLRGIIVLGAFFSWCGPAHAIVSYCQDGTAVGPLFPPNVCEGHGGLNGSHSNADQGTGQQEQTQAQATTGPRDITLQVEFTFTTYNDCVTDLGEKCTEAQAGVHLPPAPGGIAGFCRGLYPPGASGQEKTTLQTRFDMISLDGCKADLTTKIAAADGVLKFTNGDTATSVCNGLYRGGSSGASAHIPPAGEPNSTGANSPSYPGAHVCALTPTTPGCTTTDNL